MRALIGIDIDGVLAEPPPEPPRPWRFLKGNEREEHKAVLLKHYREARVLFRPDADFIAITARRRTEEIETITRHWLQDNFGDSFRNVFLLEKSRQLDNIIQHKGDVLRAHSRVEMYIDDTLAILRGLKRAGLPQEFWRYRNGRLELV